MTISENIKHVDSTGKSKLEQDLNGTKKIMINSTASTTSTSTVISQKKTISLKTNNNIVHNPTVAKNINITKHDFDGTSMKMKNQIDNKVHIEDKTLSHSYDMEAVEFLDNINFDTPDFEDDEVDYIEESI